MNMTFDRTLASNAVVVLGVCIGAWMFFVQPRAQKVQALEASMDQSNAGAADADQALFNKSIERVKSIKSQVKSIQARNGLMRDSSRLYGRIMDLAAAHHVSIQNLQPGPEKMAADATFSVSRIDMTANGEFADVAHFLEAIDGIEGFIRPVSLSLTPVRDLERLGVTAQFTCEAVSFMIPEALAELGGAHEQP